MDHSTFIKSITKEAGDLTLEYFGNVTTTSKANPGDVLTEADLASNKLITDAIHETYPDHGIISEETPDENTDAEYVWIIDPLDGTRNFASQTPLFGTIVGLARNREVIMGTVYIPFTKELFFAEKGKGAYLNDEPIQCSQKETLEYSFGVSSVNFKGPTLKVVRGIIAQGEKEKFWVSALGANAVSSAFTACGRRDWRVSTLGGVWDYAGPSIILKESGCKVTGLDGNDWTLDSKGLIAANPTLHSAVVSMVS